MELKLSQTLTVTIGFAREEAMRTGSYGISPDHFLLGILRHGKNKATLILEEMGVDLQDLKKYVDNRIFTNEHIPYEEFDNIKYSRNAITSLNLALLEAGRHNNLVVDTHHLLLSICKTGNNYSRSYLSQHDIDYIRLLAYMESNGYLSGDAGWKDDPEISPEALYDDGEGRTGENGNGTSPISIPTQPAGEKEPELTDFGYDLTAQARDGRLDPVVGRDDEIERVMEIISRRKKNSAMLIGDPGVGKSSVIEGLALRIAAGSVPEGLQGKKIISLDIASVVAGTRYRGDFEKRFKTIVDQLKADKDIILFIDEFHTLVGAGAGAGSLDAASMLKPVLARGEIQCVAATTLDEFTQIIEKDKALDRRFQKVHVKAADIPYTIEILKQLRHNYEKHHNVTYTDEAIRACAELSNRYIPEKCLPDKAIDAMDEAGAMVRLLRKGKKKNALEVTAEDIATIISRTTGIPVNKITESEGHRLLNMKERLESKVIGQDEAVEKVVRAIQRGRAGIKDPDRPIGSFMFFGPTGVGKTHLAKAIAEYLFDSQDNIVRIDMSEYMEKINVTRLIGAPPGYVGFEEGGQLSEQVRRKPYCVVLLDEIEKAHRDVFNLLLQVIDEGRLTDSNGRTVDFRNTILIMTSNIGSREIEEYGNGVGFKTQSRNIRANRKAIVEKAVKKEFSPEFINRVDEQIYFNSLTKEDIGKIIDIELEGLYKRARTAGFDIRITPAAKQFVADAGYDPKFGARPLRRAVQKYIENPVSEFIINEKIRGIRQEEEGLPCIRIGLDRKTGSTKISLK